MKPSKNDPNRNKEIAASKRSSTALTEYLQKNDNIVLAIFYKPDKYGRLLRIFYDKCGDDINKWMVSQGFEVIKYLFKVYIQGVHQTINLEVIIYLT